MEKKTLGKLFECADGYNALDALNDGKIMSEAKSKMAATDDSTRAIMQRAVKDLAESKNSGKWNCDDISFAEAILGLRPTDLFSAICVYCALNIPTATVSNGKTVRLRFHPQGGFGVSITSWMEIALIRYGGHGPENSLIYENELGYGDIQRFANTKKVCAEISRIEAILAKRRKKVSESKALDELRQKIASEKKFSSAKIWTLVDEGLTVELEAGVTATVVLDFSEAQTKRRRGGKRRNGSERKSGRVRRRANSSSLYLTTNDKYSDKWHYRVEGSPQAIFNKLLRWLHDHQFRKEAFRLLLAALVVEAATGVITAFCPTNPAVDIRLVEVKTQDKWRPSMKLWATAMCGEDFAYIKMYPHIYSDDSCADPWGKDPILKIVAAPGVDVVNGFSSKLESLLVNFRKVSALFASVVGARMRSGKWGDRESGSSVTIQPCSRWGAIDIFTPRWLMLSSEFSTDDWGLKLSSPEKNDELMKTEEDFEKRFEALAK